MKCPHCGINFHENWYHGVFAHHGNRTEWNYKTARCPNCKKLTILVDKDGDIDAARMVVPIANSRGLISKSVPKDIAKDFDEACNVLPISAKASAALSRRCLQNILNNFGYAARDLAKQIDGLLNEADARKAVPLNLHQTIDAIRNFGNFSAHPIDEKTTLQVIDVEPEEAEWCLEILEEMFEHFYERPAVAAAKKAALDAKLAAAGKPPAK